MFLSERNIRTYCVMLMRGSFGVIVSFGSSQVSREFSLT